MGIMALSESEREEMRRLVRDASRTRVSRRAQAMLALDRGAKAEAIALMVEAGVSTVYGWAKRFRDRSDGTVEQRLDDGSRSGRPAEVGDAVKDRLATLMERSPTESGYRHTVWTTPLLRHHLKREGIAASEITIRRALRALGYRWKRPRYVLSRRSPTWRQAKGG